MQTVEGKAKISAPDGVFFNPHMELCRSIASLWVGTLPEKQSVLDGFCASGARGIRYKMENKNVAGATFVDMSEKALKAAKSNAKKNKIKGAKFAQEDIRKFLLDGRNRFSLYELDPFGTPVPYLADVMRSGELRGVRYLSATATDMAVLCGAHHAACVKNYGARPLNCEFCHENAVRILIGRIAREAAQNNWGTDVELSISHRHYVKVFLRLSQGAEKAVEGAKMAARHVSYCRKCGWRKLGRFPEGKCAECGHAAEWGGPLWGGTIMERKTLLKMAKLYKAEKFLHARELENLLNTMLSECEGPAFYYDLHEVASRGRKAIPRMEDMVDALKKGGFSASRTHFSPTAVRTDAPLKEIVSRLG